MNTAKMFSVILGAVVLALVLSCSSGEDADEKGRIEQATEKIGQEAAEMIKKPLNEANRAAEIAGERSRQVEEAVQRE